MYLRNLKIIQKDIFLTTIILVGKIPIYTPNSHIYIWRIRVLELGRGTKISIQFIEVWLYYTYNNDKHTCPMYTTFDDL